MKKKKLCFIQVGFAFDKSVYLPYAVGTLIAAAFRNADIAESYEVDRIIFRREAIDGLVESLDEPAVAAFSNYVWNCEYNKALASAIKAKFPDCLIVFGGHNVNCDGSLLDECSFVDLLLYGEGEIPFTQLLRALDSCDFSSVASAEYRKDGKRLRTTMLPEPSLDELPSPYLTGVFDAILAETPHDKLLAVIETNRGCPYSCAYCDWCSGKKVRQFPLEKVFAEFRWLAENKIEYVFCADSNFGMFERDLDIVNELVSIKKSYGYPQVFRPCYAKNSDDRVYEICRALNSERMDKGATFAYQTLSAEALENINRKNLTLEHFSALMKKYNETGIPSYSELILGLPGETYESFCAGICRLIEAGQHKSISVYHCELLPNSEMGSKEYIEKHLIETVKIEFNHMHSAAAADAVQEYSNIVVATRTMSREDWVRANLFSVCVQCFHHLGLLRCFAIYLHLEKGVSYYTFYQALLHEVLEKQPLFAEFEKKLSSTLAGDWNYSDPLFGDATWLFEEGAFLKLLSSGNSFWEQIEPFLRSFQIDEEIFAEMLRYQRAIIKLPAQEKFSESFDYDFVSYFSALYAERPIALEKCKNTVTFLCRDKVQDWASYAREIVWYGRRRGATLHTTFESDFILG